MTKLITISELSKKIGLINSNKNKSSNYVLRYWEREFKQIKPKIINKHRYYTNDQVEIIKLINFLIKDKGITIKGTKKILNLKIKKLDDYKSYSLKDIYYKKTFSDKAKVILEKIKTLKRYGKKNTFKSKNGS